MIVIATVRVPCIVDPFPGILFDVHVSRLNVPILGEIVTDEKQTKLLGTLDAKLFGQQIDGVLLRVGGHNVGIVTCDAQ